MAKKRTDVAVTKARASPDDFERMLGELAGCGFFSVDLRAIHPLKRSTYTGTYTESADKDLQRLARS